MPDLSQVPPAVLQQIAAGQTPSAAPSTAAAPASAPVTAPQPAPASSLANVPTSVLQAIAHGQDPSQTQNIAPANPATLTSMPAIPADAEGPDGAKVMPLGTYTKLPTAPATANLPVVNRPVPVAPNTAPAVQVTTPVQESAPAQSSTPAPSTPSPTPVASSSTTAPAAAPMIPMQDPSAPLREQGGALHDVLAAYNKKLANGQATSDDVNVVRQQMNNFVQWAGENGFGQDPTVQQFINTNRERNYNIDDPPAPGQNNTMLGNILPDLKKLGSQALQDTVLNGFGYALNQKDGTDLTNEGTDLINLVNPVTYAKSTAVRGLTNIVGGVLQGMDTEGGSGPNDPGAQVKQGAQQLATDVHDHPVISAVNLLPLAAPLLHTVGGAVLDAADPAGIADMNLNPTRGEVPAQLGNVQPKPTVRVVDGEMIPVKPVDTAPAAAPATPIAASLAAKADTLDRIAASLPDSKAAAHVQEQADALKQMVTPQAETPAAAAASEHLPAVSVQASAPDLSQVPTEHLQAIANGQSPASVAPAGNISQVPVSVLKQIAAQAEAPHTSAEASQVTPEASATAAAKPSGPEMAGSINLDRMNISDAAKQNIRDATQRLMAATPDGQPTLSHSDAQSAAAALNLTPEMAKQIPLGESPSGVHPGIYSIALRNLVAAHAEALRSDVPDDARPGLQATHDDLVQRSGALSRVQGQGLSMHNAIASPLEQAVADVTAKQQVLARVPELTQPPALSVKTGGRRAYGASNKLVTTEARDAALARIRQNVGGLNAVADPTALLPAFKDLAVVGAYHVEAGLRNFGDWAAAMKGDVPAFGGLDNGSQQQIYAASRASVAQGRTGQLKSVGQQVFADALAPKLGLQGASQYINDIADGPHPALLGKLLTGDDKTLTPAERQFANDRYQANLPKRGAAPSQHSLSAVKAITKEFADANRKQRLAALRANRSPNKPLADPLTRSLLGRMSRSNGDEFVRRLNSDPTTADTVTKLKTNQELTDAEKRAVAGHLDDLKRTKSAAAPSDVAKTLTGIVRDAKAGRIGFESAKAVVQHELTRQVDPGKIGPVNEALSKVGDNDFKALGDLYNQHSPAGALDKARFLQQASLLSGPRTIGSIALGHVASAGVENALVRPVAAALSRGTVEGYNPSHTLQSIQAGMRAIPEAGQILKDGPAAAQLQGISPHYRMSDLTGHGLHSEPVIPGIGSVGNAVVRTPGRVHAALYHIIGSALEEHGALEAAALKARKLGGTAAQYIADPDVKAAASQMRQEQMFQNSNWLADRINDLASARGRRGLPPTLVDSAAKAIVNGLLPFRGVPLNLTGRGIEYSGAGLPIAGARLAHAKMTGQEVTPEMTRSLATQAARGIVGPVAGLGAGYALAKSGVLNPPNQKQFENGSINAGRYKLDIGRLQPVSTPILEGGELYNATHGKPASALAPFADNPLLTLSDMLDTIRGTGHSKPNLARVAGGIVGPLSPTLLSQIASATDPSGETRKKATIADYLANRVPGLRETLPATAYEQPSNLHAQGLLGLLSPINVTKRRR